MVTIDGDSGNGDELTKLRESEAFFRGCRSCNNRCVFGSMMVGREYQLRQGPCQKLWTTHSYSFLCPPGTGAAAHSAGGGGVDGGEKGSWRK